MVWNLFPFKDDFSFGKSQTSQGAKSGLYGCWVTWVIWCFTKKLHETWGMSGCAVMKLLIPVAYSCGLLNHLNNVCRGRVKLKVKFDPDSLLYLLSHFECDGHTVHTLTQWHLPPHWLLQWSHHCSHMCIPDCSSWLPRYSNVVQIIFIILTMAGLFMNNSEVSYYVSTMEFMLGTIKIV